MQTECCSLKFGRPTRYALPRPDWLLVTNHSIPAEGHALHEPNGKVCVLILLWVVKYEMLFLVRISLILNMLGLQLCPNYKNDTAFQCGDYCYGRCLETIPCCQVSANSWEPSAPKFHGDKIIFCYNTTLCSWNTINMTKELNNSSWNNENRTEYVQDFKSIIFPDP